MTARQRPFAGTYRPDLLTKFSFAYGLLLAIRVLSATSLIFFLGCGGTDRNSKPVSPVPDKAQEEFEWGLRRLDRALRLFRPGGSDGLNIMERKLDSKLFPPDDENPVYRARVTVTTETAFLHGRRRSTQEDKSAAADESTESEDPLDNETDEWDPVADFAATGRQAPAATSRIETRSIEHETVFEMTHVQGRWKLDRLPELKHEQLWFEYAFE